MNVTISKRNFPYLHSVLDEITADGGSPCAESYTLPMEFLNGSMVLRKVRISGIQLMEAILKVMNPEDRESLAIGEESDRDAVLAQLTEQHGIDYVSLLDDWLNYFFDHSPEQEVAQEDSRTA